MALGFAFGRAETACRGLPEQVGQNDRLRLGSDGNHTLLVVVLGLVACRAVFPNVPGTVNVHRPELANLARPATRQALETDHIGHNPGQRGQGGLDNRVTDGGNLGGFPCRAAALPESLHGGKAMIDRSGNQFPAYSPLEATADFVYHVVDVAAGKVLLGKLLLDCQQAERAEIPGKGPAVKVLRQKQGALDIFRGKSLDAVFLVIAVGKILVGCGKFNHGHSNGLGGGAGLGNGIDGQLGNEAGIGFFALGAAVAAEVMTFALDLDKGLTASLVVAVLGNGNRDNGHGSTPFLSGRGSHYPFAPDFQGCTADRRQVT